MRRWRARRCERFDIPRVRRFDRARVPEPGRFNPSHNDNRSPNQGGRSRRQALANRAFIGGMWLHRFVIIVMVAAFLPHVRGKADAGSEGKEADKGEGCGEAVSHKNT